MAGNTPPSIEDFAQNDVTASNIPPDDAPPATPISLTQKKVVLINPKGDSFEISNPEKAAQLQSVGWRPETKDEFVQRNIRDVVKENPITSSIAAFTGQLTNQALLGIPEIERENAFSPEDNSQNRMIDKAIKEEHPVFNIAGGAIGTGASLLLTPFGKALDILGDSAVKGVQAAASLGGETTAKLAASKITSTAIKYAAENAGYNVPYHAAESILGDPNIAHEGFMASVGEDLKLGAEFGVGASIVGPALKLGAGIASNVVSPEKLQALADKFQFKNTGALTREFNKLGEVTGKKFTADQLESATDLLDEHAGAWAQFLGPNAIYNKILESQDKAANTLTGIRAAADKEIPDGAIPHSDLQGALSAIRDKYSQGELPPQTIPGEEVSTPSTAEEYQQAIAQYGSPENIPTGTAPTTVPGTSAPSKVGDLKAIAIAEKELNSFATQKLRALGFSDEEIAQKLASGDLPNYTHDEVHNLRQQMKSAIFNEEKVNGILTEGGNSSWKAIGTVMNDSINSIAEQTGNKTFQNAFQTANKTYRDIKTMTEHILKSAATKANARNETGLTARMWGIADSVARGNVAGLQGLAKGYLLQHYGNYAMYQTLGGAAKLLEGLTSKIDGSISDFLSSTPEKNALRIGSVGMWSRYANEDNADPQQTFGKIQNDLNFAQSSPQSMETAISTFLPNASEFMPENYAMMGNTMQNAVTYLRSNAPVPPQPIFPGGPIRPWQPSDNELSKYSRRVDAVFNPMSILDEVRTGTLTKEAVDAVKTVYPNLYQAVQTKIQEKLASAPSAQVYRIRQKLGLLLEGMEDPQSRAARIQGLQAAFAPNNNHVQPRANSKITEDKRYSTNLDGI